ncbi:Gene 88 protein [uncultured Caudovirales phage]|uniref:Gene 88 protein n=1 Tax=uncultured Caudovirales phage TaxID=2100421 RepID=A0A6J5LGY8_9CAUD|nr:Gene 88 protein [uncultured Caudovirales phage]
MKISEILIEAAGAGKLINGMVVQTVDEFLKSNGIKPAKVEPEPEALEEAENPDINAAPAAEYQPIKFDPKYRPQYSGQTTATTQPSPADAYSKVISPQEVASIAHEKGTYVIYYTYKNNSGQKSTKRITQAPIYIGQQKIQQLANEAEAETNALLPIDANTPAEQSKKIKTQRKTKAYLLLGKKMEDFALKTAIEQNKDVQNILTSGKVNVNQLKAGPYITTGKKVAKPAVHKSSVPIIDENNEIVYDLDGLAERIKTRPEKLIKANEKMLKSAGSDITMANIGIPAITGLVIDERTGEFRVVQTCPGAGICKEYCYATRGGYIQYSASSESQMRILNYWYNDPTGFKEQLIRELSDLVKEGVKVYFRWHDSGDFFTNAYLDLAFDVANALKKKNVTIYAYTKIAAVANNPKIPKNFLINFSAGAKANETKQINFKTTKFSEVVPKELFKDFNTTGIGLKQLQDRDPIAQQRMKQALAKYYNINVKSVLTYDEMLALPEGKKLKYNVMIVPSLDGDLAAARRDVLGSYLLYH